MEIRTVRNVVAGQHVETGTTFDAHHPVTGEVAARVHQTDRGTVDAAVAAARSALTGPWGRLTSTERIDLVVGVAEGVTRRFEEFVEAEVSDTGQAYTMAERVNIPRGAANFTAFAHTLREHAEQAFHLETPDGLGALNVTTRRPRGVIGVISPWDAPMLLMTWKVGPALAFGNTVVVKPSEITRRPRPCSAR